MYSSNRAYEGSIRVSGRPVKEVHHRGQTYIEGRKGTEYTLHFKNDTAKPVLVIPSVDGLCVIDGKPAGRSSPGFIVGSYSTIEVPGWMVDESTAAKFTFWPQDARGEATYVEELSKSGATVDVGNQGLIGFLVIEQRVKNPILRSTNASLKGWYGSGGDERMMFSASSNTTLGMTASTSTMDTDASMGTKFGESTDFSTTTSIFERGSVVAELVLEYDTLRGLKDRGVPVHKFKGTDKMYGKRSAFPADNNVGCTPPKGWNK